MRPHRTKLLAALVALSLAGCAKSADMEAPPPEEAQVGFADPVSADEPSAAADMPAAAKPMAPPETAAARPSPRPLAQKVLSDETTGELADDKRADLDELDQAEGRFGTVTDGVITNGSTGLLGKGIGHAGPAVRGRPARAAGKKRDVSVRSSLAGADSLTRYGQGEGGAAPGVAGLPAKEERRAKRQRKRAADGDGYADRGLLAGERGEEKDVARTELQAMANRRNAEITEDNEEIIEGEPEDTELPVAPDLTYVAPGSFLPRMFYFENTYLGGSAAHAEHLRRLDTALAESARPYHLAHLGPQLFDPPEEAGLALSARVDASYVDQPRRVLLQVGIQGSERYGWRRPPLDMVLVVDAPAVAGDPEGATNLILELLRTLGPQDRLGIVVARGNAGAELAPLARLRKLRVSLPPLLEQLDNHISATPVGLYEAMGLAGQLLRNAAVDSSAITGSQTILMLTRGTDASRVAYATRAAHELTVQGVVTSVIELSPGTGGGWWQVPNAGHGNYHRVADEREVGAAVAEELATLSRVVARLLRINIRLGKKAKAIRVLGSRVLDEEEARQVKAREVATDRQLSRTMGIKADRGEDDDGIQTVIPYFYGGDAHVILVELWVEGSGDVAEVTLRYKDMVNQRNATARTAVALGSAPEELTGLELSIRRNRRGFLIGEALERAGHRVRHRDPRGAEEQLVEAMTLAGRTTRDDQRMVRRFRELVGQGEWLGSDAQRRALSEALVVAGRQRVGQSR